MAAETLGIIGDVGAVHDLLRILDDHSPEVRFWSCYALGLVGDAGVLPHVRRLATHDEGETEFGSVRKEAREAIQEIRE